MAFKLEGNQFGKIRQAKKIRVSKLLGASIPESEVFKMRDGRIACLVCASRPVFDTISMLTIHRKGRKHIEAVHKHVKYSEQQYKTSVTKQDKEVQPLLSHTKLIVEKIETQNLTDLKLINDEGACLSSQKQCSTPVTIDTEVIKLEEATPIVEHSSVDEPESESNLELQRKYLHMRSSGWLPNNDGSWKKDPNVEFDSSTDEEEKKEE